MNTPVTRTIAIVEDEEGIRDNYAEALRAQGFRVHGYGDRRQAQEAFARDLPDLAILDIGLDAEAEGGFELCRWLRARSETLPIMFLTARDSDLDAVSGLRLGADDYLTKDISLPQMMARVVALFRRVDAMREPAESDDVLVRGSMSLSPERMVVSWKGEPIALTVTEFWMVHSLARRPGHVKSRDQLMQDASVLVDDATVTSHVKRIRRKFQAADPDFAAIDTVYGAGYRWKPD